MKTRKQRPSPDKRKPGIYHPLSAAASQSYRAQLGDQIHVGRAARQLRQAKGLKAVDVARKAGLDPRTFAAIESGHIRNPSMVKLEAIADSLGISLPDLFLQTQVSRPENFYLGEQKGNYTLEFQQDGFKLVSYVPMNPDFFIGKAVLAGKVFLDAGRMPFNGRIFIQMILGKLKLTVRGEDVQVKEGGCLLINGRLPHTFQNPLIKESSFLFVSVPSFVTFTSRG